MKSGFSIIELLVVFSIITIFSVITIPSYINFNRSQEVKQSVLSVKSILRDLQNRSMSGEKDKTNCSTNTLDGFYADFSLNQNAFNIGGICGSYNFSTSTQKLTSSKSTIIGIYNPLVSCASNITLSSGILRLVFKPIGKGIEFYDNSAIPNTLSNNKISLKFGDGTTSYYLMIAKSGEIYESQSCP